MVAAGAVVRGDIEDHAVMAGSPARVVRRLEPGVGWVSTGGDVRPLFGGMPEPEAGVTVRRTVFGQPHRPELAAPLLDCGQELTGCGSLA